MCTGRPKMPKLYILMEIGCIECGLKSQVVGVFDDRAAAEREAATCFQRFHWRNGGENSFEVFDIDTDVTVMPSTGHARVQPGSPR